MERVSPYRRGHADIGNCSESEVRWQDFLVVFGLLAQFQRCYEFTLKCSSSCHPHPFDRLFPAYLINPFSLTIFCHWLTAKNAWRIDDSETIRFVTIGLGSYPACHSTWNWAIAVILYFPFLLNSLILVATFHLYSKLKRDFDGLHVPHFINFIDAFQYTKFSILQLHFYSFLWI